MNPPSHISDAARKAAQQLFAARYFRSGVSSRSAEIIQQTIDSALAEANAEKERLRAAYIQNGYEIEQLCGQALGYPWFKDDQKNFPGATEKDGVCVGEHVAATIVAELVGKFKEKDKEIAELQKQVAALREELEKCAIALDRLKRGLREDITHWEKYPDTREAIIGGLVASFGIADEALSSARKELGQQ